jgi:hypothetical protein
MKRAIAAALLALALLPGAAADASRAGDSVQGPPCADITVSNVGVTNQPGTVLPGGIVVAPGSNAVGADLETAAPSCAGATYTASVSSGFADCTATECQPAGTTESVSFSGDGSTESWRVALTVADDDTQVCVWATAEVNGRVVDRAPNTGCGVFASGPGSGIGMR